MGNTEKIKAITKEYKALFRATDMDVAQSIKGRWYFSRYNSEMEYYECFYEFDTAEELIDIIIGELTVEMNFLIDNHPTLPKYESEDMADNIDYVADFDNEIECLANSLAMILDTDKADKNVKMLLEALQSLIKEKQEMK